jgi:hypothetical protein
MAIPTRYCALETAARQQRIAIRLQSFFIVQIIGLLGYWFIVVKIKNIRKKMKLLHGFSGAYII